MLLKKSLVKAPWCMVGLCALILVGCGKKKPLKTTGPAVTMPAVQPATPPATTFPLHQEAGTTGLKAIPLYTEPIVVPSTQPSLLPSTPAAAVPQIKTEQKEKKSAKKKSPRYDSNNPDELDFDVENHAGRKLFVTCFSYQVRRELERWRWIKSPVYEIEPYEVVTIDVDTISQKLDRSFVFGYLGVFPTRAEAEDATFELLSDKQKLDLDLLINLKGKKVSLMIERYGMKGEKFDYDFLRKDQARNKQAKYNLKFSVENGTGKTIFVSCFVYEKRAKGSWVGATEEKDDMTPWHYEKMNVLRLAPNQIGEIDVGSISTLRDKTYIRGKLAIFDETQEQLAYASTYELLPPGCKVNLGPLWRIANKKIVLDVENYGIMQDYLNYTVKPVNHIDFKAIHQKKR
ncbi:hypothetical protein FJ365_05925 [Candidatus Dependentiae bacterium]|nr:hypothetical protein [Candidatus Dependentiae bacterium]